MLQGLVRLGNLVVSCYSGCWVETISLVIRQHGTKTGQGCALFGTRRRTHPQPMQVRVWTAQSRKSLRALGRSSNAICCLAD